jgi:AcrR family transcriptional regulator
MNPAPQHPTGVDHRSLKAGRQRDATRRCLIEATIRVLARQVGHPPVIEDVVREACVARATFYKYFCSLDEVILAARTCLNDQFHRETERGFRIFVEPWQQSCVSIRLFMTRAASDKVWGRFMTDGDAWVRDSVVGQQMLADYREGVRKGQFARVADEGALLDMVMGVHAHCALALVRGVDDPQAYIDTVVRTLMRTLGLSEPTLDQAVAYSRKHVEPFLAGEAVQFSGVPGERRPATPDAPRTRTRRRTHDVLGAAMSRRLVHTEPQ